LEHNFSQKYIGTMEEVNVGLHEEETEVHHAAKKPGCMVGPSTSHGSFCLFLRLHECVVT
jgi:hypothetical protein